MEALPEDVEASLLRGVAAYLRATPATELPSRLRRFQNFRPKGLSAHKHTIIDALDDDAFRALVAEWLEERPALPKADAALLRIAAGRRDGWHDQLAAASAAKAAAPKSNPRSSVQPEREQERLRKAREEARRKLEGAQREIRALQGRVAELEEESKLLVRSRATLEKELATSRRAADKAAADLEREQRKSRAQGEKAESNTTKVRAELKEMRRELQSLRREADRSKAATKPKPAPRKKAPSATKGPRRALPVPKGRFEDDPATLESWLGVDGVHLLVDGYNASMSPSGFAHLDLAGQRQRLVDELTKLARRTGVGVTVVFDGSDVSGVVRQPRGPAKVQYSAPDEIADDRLIGLIETMPPSPVIVATNDRELQERAASLGATVATSEQLLSLLR